MKYLLFDRKPLIFLVVVAVSIAFCLGSEGIIHAQEGFETASVQGNYAFTVTSGSNEAAAVGVFTTDGNGNTTGSGIFNVPQLFRKKRTVVTFSFDSTFTLNPDGIGTGEATVTFEDGSELTSKLDFVITKAEVQESGIKLALETFCMLREPLPLSGGAITTIISRRLPD